MNNIVSGALDRLHYEKDPCVKYDLQKKLWIYLHKNRSLDYPPWKEHLNKSEVKESQGNASNSQEGKTNFSLLVNESQASNTPTKKKKEKDNFLKHKRKHS